MKKYSLNSTIFNEKLMEGRGLMMSLMMMSLCPAGTERKGGLHGFDLVAKAKHVSDVNNNKNNHRDSKREQTKENGRFETETFVKMFRNI